jgi:RND family efflux transporter MFP subunit
MVRLSDFGFRVLLFCALPLLAADAPKPLDVKVTRPSRGDIVRYVTLPGTIKANQQVTMYAKTAGYLTTIKVDKGDSVKAGDLLAEIESPELVADQVRSEAEVKKAQAERLKAAAETKLAQVEYGRLVKAQKQSPDLVMPQTLDVAKARLDMAEANDKTAEAAEEVAKASLKRIETLLGYARLTAPFNGVVTARQVDPGAFIPAATSGIAAQTAAVLTLMDFETVRAQVPIPEIESTLVRQGQPVKVSIEGLPGRSFEGKVTRFAYALDEATRTMLVEADLPNPRRELRPGMYAMIKVGLEQHTNTLTVPVEALVMEKINAFVFVNASGKARKTAIQTGFNDGAKVEVLGGLTGDESVLLVGKLSIADGTPVNAIEAK